MQKRGHNRKLCLHIQLLSTKGKMLKWKVDLNLDFRKFDKLSKKTLNSCVDYLFLLCDINTPLK